MTIKDFIEKAIEGGWKEFFDFSFLYTIGNTVTLEYGKTKDTVEKQLHEIVLDPKAWEAVGKVERWEENSINNIVYTKGYQYKMNNLMPHLQEGGTIESYIETL